MNARGFTVLEALIALAVTALIAAMVLPTVTQGVRDSFRRADREQEGADRLLAEAEFRRLLRGAVQPNVPTGTPPLITAVTGDAHGLAFAADVAGPGPCARGGGRALVRLRVVSDGRGGRLVCEASGRSVDLARWDHGAASFAYGVDGAVWRRDWPEPGRWGRPQTPGSDRGPPVLAPLVRLEVRDGARSRLLWIERASDQAAPIGDVFVQTGGAP